METTGVDPWTHDHQWIEDNKTATGVRKHCDGCGMIMATACSGAGAERTFEQRVIETVVADIKANGKIRMALLGIE